MKSNDAVREVMVAVLGKSAVPREVLLERVLSSGMAGSESSIELRVDSLLQLDTSFGEVADDIVFIPALLEGTTWTVFVDGDDAANGFLRILPQLSPLSWWLISDRVVLIDGNDAVLGELSTDGLLLDEVDADVVFGPPGWLDDVAGGWAAVAVRGGALSITSIGGSPLATSRQVTAMRKGFEQSVGSRDSEWAEGESDFELVSDEESVLGALVADREAFVSDPVPVLSELFAASGLEERASLIAAEGFDWVAYRSWQQRTRAKWRFGLDERQVDDLFLLAGACELHADIGVDSFGSDDEARHRGAARLSALLDDSDVALAFLEEVQSRGGSAESVASFGDELAEWMHGSVTRAGLAWLRSRCREELGDVRGGLELLEAGVDDGCTHRQALLDLAGFASDRGDAATAWQLLRRTGALEQGDEELDDETAALIKEVGPYAMHRPRAAVGRNEPCPCGSGRKYKACHLGREQHPLVDRCTWLYSKASRYVQRCAQEILKEVSYSMTAESPWLADELQMTPFFADVALHEYGVDDEFLAERGWLLPGDEALLAAQWALVDRGVFEITRIRGETIELHDIGRGEHIRVTNVTPGDATRAGMVVVGRPLPVGDSHRAYSGLIPIPRALVNPIVDAIISDDVDRFTELMASILRPPQLQNTDGDDMVLHTMRWKIAPGTDVGMALSGAGLLSEDDGWWRLVADTKNQPDSIVSTVQVEAETLTMTGEVNSDERAERLAAIIADALPEAALIDDYRRDIGDAADEHEPSDDGLPSFDDPEMFRVIEEMIIAREREWVDESIPALGGRTPRESVRDPVGREEVLQLLASFPEPPPGSIGAMRPSRLRALLDLR